MTCPLVTTLLYFYDLFCLVFFALFFGLRSAASRILFYLLPWLFTCIFFVWFPGIGLEFLESMVVVVFVF